MSPKPLIPFVRPLAAVKERMALAERLLKEKNPEQAQVALASVLELDPDHAVAHARRSALCIHASDWQGLALPNISELPAW